MDERVLIRRVLAGEPSAERELYDTHVDRVFRLCYRMAGDEELAREFTQETFIRAFDRLSGFRGEAALSTWLHAIAVSVALNGLRKIKRFRARETDLDDALPELYRVVFLMHDAEGYTHKEIGATLGVPTGTSKARLSRARALLREALSDFAEEFAR